ncbi:MAG: M48 family metallopeptidase [Bacteroidales bacterium]|nr:M48 family metallopeptidase [Bacteroidales bacterium]
MKKVILPLLIVCAFVMQSCSTVAVTGRNQLNLVSDSEVLTASLTQYSDYMKTAKKSTNATQTAQVVRVGKKIAAATEQYLRNNGLASEIQNFSWEFNLVQSDEVNAFCMPGGKIVVYEGIMKLISSDDELAVIIGHEVAHAVAKHSNERMSQQVLAQYGAQALSVAMAEKSAVTQQVANTVYGLGAQYGVMLPFSRKHESEADYMGLVFMELAGYKLESAVTFWQKMSSQGSYTPEFMSTHPSDTRRINDINAAIPEVRQKY